MAAKKITDLKLDGTISHIMEMIPCLDDNETPWDTVQVRSEDGISNARSHLDNIYVSMQEKKLLESDIGWACLT
jgi:hypothetical protein